METHITTTAWIVFITEIENNIVKSVICDRVFTSEKEAREYVARNPGTDLVSAPLIIEKSLL